MPRYDQRTSEGASIAGSEALRGAIVGGAKVRIDFNKLPHTSEALYTSPRSPSVTSADIVIVIVGPHLRRTWCRRILPLAHLQKLDRPIQSVR